jgi:L-fucose dehydrogenase
MNLHLKEKIIIVTGGAKGIGEGIVKVLANEGAIPVIIGRNEKDNNLLVENLAQENKQSYQIVAELSNPDSCKNAVNLVMQKFGKIDGLVNNAGVNDGVGLENGNYEIHGFAS